MPVFVEDNKKLDQVDAQFMGASDAAWYNQGGFLRYLMSYSIVIFIIVFLTWSYFAEIDEVTKGTGKVVPSQRLQLIQHLEGGILVDVMVKEGDKVSTSQNLARVDSVNASSVVRDAQTKIWENEAAILRLEAELNNSKEIVFTPELIEKAGHIVEQEKGVFEVNKRKVVEEEMLLDLQIRQKEQELNESISRKATFADALVLAEERERKTAPLVARKLYSEIDFLNLKQEVVRLRGDLRAIDSSIGQLESSLDEAVQRKELAESTLHTEKIKEAAERRSELASLRETFTAGKDRVMRTELRSPVDGVVNRILINTIGGIVKPGEEIMEIIPFDDSLVIEARIKPSDIAFIRPEQKAVVKITAYDYAIYGSFEGIVEQIGADTLTDEKGESYYLIKVRTTKNSITYNGKELAITPGMVASVDVLTGKRTVLNFILKPILRQGNPSA